MVDLALEVWKRDGWTVVGISGEVDVSTAPRLRQELLSLLDSGTTHLILDLDSVGLLDSTGLGVLIGLLKRLRGQGGEMVVLCTEPRIRRMFAVTRLDRAFDVVGSLAEVSVL